MALVPGSAGNGWKAQVVRARRLGALAAGLPAGGAVGWARLSGREAAAARWIERLTGTHEAVLGADLTEWHDYALEWRAPGGGFLVGRPPGGGGGPPAPAAPGVVGLGLEKHPAGAAPAGAACCALAR